MKIVLIIIAVLAIASNNKAVIFVALGIYGIWWVLTQSAQTQYDKNVDLIVFAVILGISIASL